MTADIVRAAVTASKPHAHRINPYNEDKCDACGMTLDELNRRQMLQCNVLVNRKRLVPPWGS